MKKIFLSIAALIVLSINTNAQKTLEQGFIKMEITDVTSDDEQMAMMLQMMKGSQTEVHFKGDRYVTNMNMMGGMVTMKTYVDEDKKGFDMLMDAMGQKFWVASTLDEARGSEQAEVAKNAKVTYDKNDKKTILGYDAYKVSIELPNQEGMMITGYITEAIKTKANLMQGMEALKLNGYPLEFTVKNPQMTLTMTTKEIKDEVDMSKLELKTDGFTKMTMEEFTKQMGGMSGMGF